MKMDGMIRLFDGDYTASEVLSMDIPSQRVMIAARLQALKESQEKYKSGIVDAYSRRYANTMGSFDDLSSLSRSLSPPSQEESIEQNDYTNNNDSNRSLNIRAR